MFNLDNKPDKIFQDWDKHLEKVYTSIEEDKLVYPVILFSDYVIWDIEVYTNPLRLICDSISGHWGYNNYLSDKITENEIIIDSHGNTYKLSHEHFCKDTKTSFSYPSILVGKENLMSIKQRIIKCGKNYIETFDEHEEIILAKIEILKEINSIKDLILFFNKEFKKIK